MAVTHTHHSHWLVDFSPPHALKQQCFGCALTLGDSACSLLTQGGLDWTSFAGTHTENASMILSAQFRKAPLCKYALVSGGTRVNCCFGTAVVFNSCGSFSYVITSHSDIVASLISSAHQISLTMTCNVNYLMPQFELHSIFKGIIFHKPLNK